MLLATWALRSLALSGMPAGQGILFKSKNKRNIYYFCFYAWIQALLL